MAIEDVLADNKEMLCSATKRCLQELAEAMFTNGLINASVRNSANFDDIIDEVKCGMTIKEEISDLDHHCCLFLNCLSDQGGPARQVAHKLRNQWQTKVKEKLNVSLPLIFNDVKTENVCKDTITSPVNDKPSSASRETEMMLMNAAGYLMAKPQIDQLLHWLQPLVDWNIFGYHLPGITDDIVQKIDQDEMKTESKKRALYSKWLDVCPNPSWSHVLIALKKSRMNALASNIHHTLEQTCLEDRHPDPTNDNYDNNKVQDIDDNTAVMVPQIQEIEENETGIVQEIKEIYKEAKQELKKDVKDFVYKEAPVMAAEFVEKHVLTDENIEVAIDTVGDLWDSLF
jgi:hypothetical protein